MTSDQAAYVFLGAFVDELTRAGVAHVALAPGSRSTPLALMLAEHPALKLWLHLDERCAAFFALGLAKARREPVALLCTSGTAAANFFPALVEAHYARVPLLVLTADRPPELRDTGAPQTIDQIKLYGDYAKWFVEMALPEAAPEAVRYARTVAARAVAEARGAPAGVVHLNFPFREPLVPAPPEHPAPALERPASQPYLTVTNGARQAPPAAVAALAAELAAAPHGLIIAGPQTDPAFPAAVGALAERLGYPVLADPLSQARCGPHPRGLVLDSYDAFLRDAATVEALRPEVVLRFGAMPTSKPVLQYLQRHAAARQILVDEAAWHDAPRLASAMFQAEPVGFCQALTAAAAPLPPAAGAAWRARWLAIQAATRAAITTQVAAFPEPFEGRVFAELAACLPEGATLFASSSMPVRDLDTFFPGGARPVRMLANRGANGIDGVVSSAFGARAAGAGPVVLVIGDIALYHDMNGLLAARQHGLDLTIVLINNDGGGIFSFLPQAAHPKHFERLFGTPHGLAFESAAALYGARYHQPQTWPAFRAAVADSLAAGGLGLIEVRTERARNVTQHREVWRAVTAALRGLEA